MKRKILCILVMAALITGMFSWTVQGDETGAPDLVVTEISWSPEFPEVGEEVSFSATIKNQGTAATPEGVIHGVLFTVDYSAVGWSDNTTASLAPGESRTVSINGGPTDKTTWKANYAGEHKVIANVDDINRIKNESDESNNVKIVTFVVGGQAEPTAAPTPTPIPPSTPNIALGKKTKHSSVESPDKTGDLAVDGNKETRWASAGSDPQWLELDLGTNYSVNRVIIRWEAARSKDYKIQTSLDGKKWTDVYQHKEGGGSVDDIAFESVLARHIRLFGSSRTTGWGHSIWEFEVYGASGASKAALDELNAAETADAFIETLQAPSMNMVLEEFNQLHEQAKGLVSEILLNEKPAGGYKDGLVVEAALGNAIKNASFDAVNRADTPKLLRQALENPILKLDLSWYLRLTEIQKLAVAKMVHKTRPQEGFKDKVAIEEAVDAVIFADIKDHPAKGKIKVWLMQGILSGTEDVKIHPDEIITRGEFTRLVNNAFGFTEPAKKLYWDVSKKNPYAEDIRIARKAGYMKTGFLWMFRAKAGIKKQEMAEIICKLVGLEMAEEDYLSDIEDADSIGKKYRQFMNTVIGANFVNAAEGKLEPGKKLTRAEAIEALYTVVNPTLKNPNFFPIYVWLQSPANAKAYKELGINTYMGSPITEDSMNYFREVGMKHISDINELALSHLDENIIIGWHQEDEPDIPRLNEATGMYGTPLQPAEMLTRYLEIKIKDRTLPVFMNFSMGVAYTEWVGRGVDHGDISKYPEYFKAADIIGFDIYPVNEKIPDITGNLWYVAQGLDNMNEWSGGTKPMWAYVETTKYNEDNAGKPTPEQIRAQVWMAIVHGATGIGYFCHIFTPTFTEAGPLSDPEISQALKVINEEVSSLALVLNSPDVKGLVTAKSDDTAIPVDILVKKYKGDVYVFATAMRAGETTVTFHVPEGHKVEVLGEERSIHIADGTFKDVFTGKNGGYGVHLYKITE